MLRSGSELQSINYGIIIAAQSTSSGNTLQHTATHCNTLQHAATHVALQSWRRRYDGAFLQRAATHCNTLQRTATHFNALQHTATYCNTPIWHHHIYSVEFVVPFTRCFSKKFRNQSLLTYMCCSVLQCVAVCCNVLQCVAVRCNAFQCVAVCCSVCNNTSLRTYHC